MAKKKNRKRAKKDTKNNNPDNILGTFYHGLIEIIKRLPPRYLLIIGIVIVFFSSAIGIVSEVIKTKKGELGYDLTMSYASRLSYGIDVNKVSLTVKEDHSIYFNENSIKYYPEYEAAVLLCNSNKPNEAIKKLEPLATKFDDNPIIRQALGICHFNLHNFEKAFNSLISSIDMFHQFVKNETDLTGFKYYSAKTSQALSYILAGFSKSRSGFPIEGINLIAKSFPEYRHLLKVYQKSKHYKKWVKINVYLADAINQYLLLHSEFAPKGIKKIDAVDLADEMIKIAQVLRENNKFAPYFIFKIQYSNTLRRLKVKTKQAWPDYFNDLLGQLKEATFNNDTEKLYVSILINTNYASLLLDENIIDQAIKVNETAYAGLNGFSEIKDTSIYYYFKFVINMNMSSIYYRRKEYGKSVFYFEEANSAMKNLANNATYSRLIAIGSRSFIQKYLDPFNFEIVQAMMFVTNFNATNKQAQLTLNLPVQNGLIEYITNIGLEKIEKILSSYYDIVLSILNNNIHQSIHREIYNQFASSVLLNGAVQTKYAKLLIDNLNLIDINEIPGWALYRIFEISAANDLENELRKNISFIETAIRRELKNDENKYKFHIYLYYAEYLMDKGDRDKALHLLKTSLTYYKYASLIRLSNVAEKLNLLTFTNFNETIMDVLQLQQSHLYDYYRMAKSLYQSRYILTNILMLIDDNKTEINYCKQISDSLAVTPSSILAIDNKLRYIYDAYMFSSLARMGKNVEARKHFRNIITDNLRSYPDKYYLGASCITNKDYRNAIELLSTCHKENNYKFNSTVAALIGICYMKLKDLDTARKYLNQSLSIHKSNKVANEWLNKLNEYQRSK